MDRAGTGIARRKDTPSGLAAKGGVASLTVGCCSSSPESVLGCRTCVVAGGLCDGAAGAFERATLAVSCGIALMLSPVAGRAVDGRGGKALVRAPARIMGAAVASGAPGVSAYCKLGGTGADELGGEVSGLCTGELRGLSGLCAGGLDCSVGDDSLTVGAVAALLVRGLGGRGATGRWDVNGRAALPLVGRTEGGAALAGPSGLTALAVRIGGGAALAEPSSLNALARRTEGGGAVGEPSGLSVLAGRTEGGAALLALGRGAVLAIRADGGASPGPTPLLADCGAFKPTLRAGAFVFSGAALGAGLSRASSLVGATLGCEPPTCDAVDASGCCSKRPGSVVATGGGVFDRWGGLGGTILRKPGRIAGGGWEGAGTDGRWCRGARWG